MQVNSECTVSDTRVTHPLESFCPSPETCDDSGKAGSSQDSPRLTCSARPRAKRVVAQNPTNLRAFLLTTR
jgi:hypothetical protein